MRWIVDEDRAGERLDLFLVGQTELTRSRIAGLIREGACLVEEEKAQKAGMSLKEGQLIELALPEPRPLSLPAQDIPLRILYQDGDLAVVYKPSGMVVHPAAGNPDRTLVNALLFHLKDLSGIGGELRPGIVHRIDKDTSGLLLVAKNDAAHVHLAEQIRARRVKRAYYALLIGGPKEDMGSVDAPIGRHPRDRKKMAILREGREAVTDWQVLERMGGTCLVEARLKTGRTHQIRVHMTSLGCPVLGDSVYGPARMPHGVQGGQLLHAHELGFVHPGTGVELLFRAGPEQRFLYWAKKLGCSFDFLTDLD